MGRCTAVEILELEESVPSHCGPETMLRADQRLPLLEEIWKALTDAERRTISDRLDAKQHGVLVAEGSKGASDRVLSEAHKHVITGISLREHCVRWLRRMRVTAARSPDDLQIKAEEFSRNIGADAKRMLRDAEQPGETNGYPHTAQRVASIKN